MKKNERTLSFESNRIYKSLFLSALIVSINHLVLFWICFVICHIFAASFFNNHSFLLLVDSASDVLFFVLLLVFDIAINLVVKKVSTAINIIDKTIIRQFSFLGKQYHVGENVMIITIQRIVISPYYLPVHNVVMFLENGDIIRNSIKDYTKFVTLLQELNPSIEVEYKE